MKRWQTPTGAVLVALDGAFHLLEGGTLRRTWAPSDSSVEDWLYHHRYRVEGGSLWCDFSGERWNGRQMAESSVELEGLVALPHDPAEEAALRTALRPAAARRGGES